MIDSDGYRPNVGIILCNQDRQVFWGRRAGQDSWQFPQGGIRRNEAPVQAMYRELHEETGLRAEHVQLIGCTEGWLRYKLPSSLVRRHSRPVCIGQKQKWFLLRLVGSESAFSLDSNPRPEFDDWRWVEYWLPMREVVYFKRQVYQSALDQLAPLLFGASGREALVMSIGAESPDA
ncbi:MAG: RNA pyrophosphohydrolase [Halothiobacillaceae bacterium]|nr:RNA pyrophosphohydrolase [Halothiobacillaceae bacterium]